ncbi:MAG: HAMP domain-containing histidine kinase [Bacteriovoracaceae bacterium]|nr:HAMP domain-containing histidine kinase [Bacteriovoracaceae bacterium]
MDLTLYDQLQNPVLVVGKDMRIKYFNFVSTTFFKLSPRKLSKVESILELVKTDDVDLGKLIKECIDEEQAKFTQEFSTLIGASELSSTVILKFIPLDSENAAVHIMDFSIEKQLHEKYKAQIMELRDTHEQIVKSDKLTALGEMISGISHEIATPLTIVSDRLDTMQMALSTNDQQTQKEALREVKEEFARITQIISGMQSYARNQEEELQICSLNEVVQESVRFIKELNVLHEIELEVDVQGEHLTLANPLKLQQVFINLIKNSVDALRASSIDSKKITISIDESDDEQVHSVKVCDNGPGVSEENQDKVFDMFYTSKEIGEGTGLGLSISQKIIEGCNGSISLLPSDQGATFLIQLPIIEVGSYTKSNRYLRGEADIEDEKVLVIGDDVELLNSVYKILQKKHKVCVLSRKAHKVQELSDFFAIEKAIKLKECDLSFLEADVVDLVNMDSQQVVDQIEKRF